MLACFQLITLMLSYTFCRREASDLSRTKNEYLLEIEKCRQLNSELENR